VLDKETASVSENISLMSSFHYTSHPRRPEVCHAGDENPYGGHSQAVQDPASYRSQVHCLCSGSNLELQKPNKSQACEAEMRFMMKHYKNQVVDTQLDAASLRINSH